ncbi:hypothetical protein C8Q79DRAFT_974910 [Trametes meyenii]|nr:hypothetical protein C8Q79DRAFT_974910 [Trametes meyenii]
MTSGKQAMADATEAERQPLLAPGVVDTTEVYPVIHMIRHVQFLDTPLSHEALTAPDLTYTLIRPLEEKYGTLKRQGNLSVVFCLLLNRVYFFRDRNLTTAALSQTRADLCEILAIRALREHADNMLELALALTTSWSVYSGAPPALLERAREENDDDLEERVGNAIEMAILSQARRFIKSSPCQKVIDGIWILYTYKRNPIHFYDPHKAPLLDHYRFLILFVLFVFALEYSELNRINVAEVVFMVYALGFTLEKVAAMQEHGIKVYFKGTWPIVTLYCTYAVMRLLGVYEHKHWAREMGINCLALIAVLMFPRLAFVTFKNNVMVLSLRAMIVQFVVLMGIAAFCFGGFLYALWTYSAGTIAWWMLDLWFGLDASGFDNASRFHPVFGPFLMITYACLSNTLLLTGPLRTFSAFILSHTFSTINDDAAAEAMFRRAVSTVEGVKADSLFSYQPPINLFALCIMLPASYVLTPRWFHKVNVFMIRLTSFPILLGIALYERQAKSSGTFTFYETVSAAAEKIFDTLPRHFKRLTLFEGLTGPDADIDAIFELEEEFEESALDMEEGDDVPPIDAGRQRRLSQASRRRASLSSQHQRRASMSTTGRTTPPMPPSPLKVEHAGPSASPDRNQALPQLPAPQPHHIALPRTRVNSVLTRGLELAQSASSPLAQIFQPLVVDDDLAAEERSQSDAGTPGASGAAAISYGPATRRRLSSMHVVSPPRRMRTYSVAGAGHGYGATGQGQGSSLSAESHGGGGGLRRFPTTNSPVLRSHLGLIAAQAPLSESPDERGEGEDAGVLSRSPEGSQECAIGPRATAREVEDHEEDARGSEEAEWVRRLDGMEARQKRMEDMLEAVLRGLKR